jgi:hypothetical protein
MWIFRKVLLRRLFLHSSHLLVPVVTNRFLLLSVRNGCESSGMYCCVDSSRTLHTWKPGSFYASAPARNQYEVRYLADNYKLFQIYKIRVANPHHFSLDMDPAPHLKIGGNLRPLVYRASRTRFEPIELLLNCDFNADPDPAFHTNEDPDLAFKNKADRCRSGSTTLGKILLLLLLNSIRSL